MSFKDSYSCPIFPQATLTFSIRVRWSWIVAGKHITETLPNIEIMFKCPAQKITSDELPLGKCPVNEIKCDYINTQRFRNLLRTSLVKLGGPRMMPYIDMIVRGSLSLEEPEIKQITDKDGTKYQKSRASAGSPLFGKWYKKPPGYRNVTEAGSLAELVDSPPKELLQKENIYCSHIETSPT